MARLAHHNDAPYVSDNTTQCDSGSDDNDAAYQTDATDISDNEVDNSAEDDIAWLLKDNQHPPEYYVRLEENLDETEFTKEDYSPGTTLLLDRIEEQWYQYIDYITGKDVKNIENPKKKKKDPKKMYSNISLRRLNAFFDWLLNQRRGKGGRRRQGTKRTSSLGTYWKVYRLAYERATGDKINGAMNRGMHKV
jgi:hypothetical protein